MQIHTHTYIGVCENNLAKYKTLNKTSRLRLPRNYKLVRWGLCLVLLEKDNMCVLYVHVCA